MHNYYYQSCLAKQITSTTDTIINLSSLFETTVTRDNNFAKCRPMCLLSKTKEIS